MKDHSVIDRAAEIIKTGGIVAFPTETVYGLGADTFNSLSVARVFEVKGRPSFDPLIIHVADLSDVEKLAVVFPTMAGKLVERLWPGPLTIVLPKQQKVPDIVTAGLSTVAIRMPRHPMALSLIKRAACPLVGPSANPFGFVSPTTAAHVRDQLGDRIDFILDGGRCEIGVESTIISFAEDVPRLLRLGGTELEKIESIIGPVEIRRFRGGRPSAPGMLPKHYAPRTPIVLDRIGGEAPDANKKKIGLLAFREPKTSLGFRHTEVLSKSGDLREAAANLFAAIRRLDALKLDLIVAEEVPEVGLGRAIMDRLRRASGREER